MAIGDPGSEVGTMDISHAPAGSIVVGIDGSSGSDGALDWAVDQAVVEQRCLTIVHAFASGGFVPTLDDARAKARRLIDDASRHARERATDLDVACFMGVSVPQRALVDLGEQAAMVVLGSRGRGPVSSRLLGSVSVSVAMHATCPVVVSRPPGSIRGGSRIMVGVDGSAASLPAVEFAYRVASFRGDALTVMHCYGAQPAAAPSPGTPASADLEAESAIVSEALAGMAKIFPDVEITVRLIFGPADQHLVDASRDHDLVVIGHHTGSPLHDLVHGCLASMVLEHARGVVAVVPSPALASGFAARA